MICSSFSISGREIVIAMLENQSPACLLDEATNTIFVFVRPGDNANMRLVAATAARLANMIVGKDKINGFPS